MKEVARTCDAHNSVHETQTPTSKSLTLTPPHSERYKCKTKLRAANCLVKMTRIP